MPLYINLYNLQKTNERLKESLEREMTNNSCFTIFRVIQSKCHRGIITHKYIYSLLFITIFFIVKKWNGPSNRNFALRSHTDDSPH